MKIKLSDRFKIKDELQIKVGSVYSLLDNDYAILKYLYLRVRYGFKFIPREREDLKRDIDPTFTGFVWYSPQRS